jgi:disulfide bond formation protein DsbB
MKSPGRHLVIALGLVSIGVAIGAAGIYVGDTDDAPGAAIIGILLMIVAVALGVKVARRRTWHPRRPLEHPPRALPPI